MHLYANYANIHRYACTYLDKYSHINFNIPDYYLKIVVHFDIKYHYILILCHFHYISL